MATALVETGSRMDDVIFEEFKGTGNMELHLDRKLSEKRIFPAIDLNKSGTRKEDLLMTQDELEAIWAMRRQMANSPTQDVTETIIDNLAHTKNNSDFVQIIKKIFFAIGEKDGFKQDFLKDACPTPVGGQAVMEGIMMRGLERTAVAVRLPDGKIHMKTQPNKKMGKWTRIPIVRGVVSFCHITGSGHGYFDVFG